MSDAPTVAVPPAAPPQVPPARSEPERARRTLSRGILAFRWAALAWMGALALTADPLRRPALAWIAIGAAGAWTAWLSVPRRVEQPATLWFDLGLASALVLLSGLVVAPGEIGTRPFFATAYPIGAALAWGAARGPAGGLAAGTVLGIATVLSRPLNGIGLGELSRGGIQSLANGVVNYLLAGGAVGFVARLLARSETQFRAVVSEAMGARERAARLAERDSIARQIHDSVLQALALIQKRGRELGARETVAGAEVTALAEMAGEQQEALRALILRGPDDAPSGTASLRDALEEVARAFASPPVTVSAVGPIHLPAREVGEICAAVRQALDNVVRHARAARAAVFADASDGWVAVSVRDDGRGFAYDEAALRAAGKAGMLKSMKGRIEELGGTMKVESAAGAGTEVEFRVPLRGAEDGVGGSR